MSDRPAASRTVENLKKEARRWLRALRAGDADARARFDRALRDAPAEPTLRHVQHALARERGFAGWTELTARAPDDSLVDLFLRAACPDHHVRSASDHLRALHTAMRLLEQHPGIAHASFATAVVTGNRAAVARALRDDPGLAVRATGPTDPRQSAGGDSGDLFRDLGPRGWGPLLHLCFTRLAVPAVHENAVAIAELLLDAGADPAAYFMAGGSRYTPLVGVIGEGEEHRPPHSRRDELVGVLYSRGADPYDNQVIYNISFGPDTRWYLERAYARSVELGRAGDWDDPEWMMLGMGGYGSGTRWHLELAIARGDVALAEWCLAHGANPEAAPGRSGRLRGRPLYEEAVRAGQRAIAELLLRHGARPSPIVLDGIEALTESALQLDAERVRDALARHPEYLADPAPLFAAVRRNRADVVALLLDAGWSPDVQDEAGERPLHVASSHDSVAAARVLIERGAELDPVESRYGGTPLGRASYYRHQAMIDLLAERSRDIWELAFLGRVERLRELLAERPALGKISGNGQTPLMWLPPDDEGRAIEVARLFLEYGADPTLKNPEGMTAADRAERQGMAELARMLR
jgi:ankyrin repeat protein